MKTCPSWWAGVRAHRRRNGRRRVRHHLGDSGRRAQHSRRAHRCAAHLAPGHLRDRAGGVLRHFQTPPQGAGRARRPPGRRGRGRDRAVQAPTPGSPDEIECRPSVADDVPAVRGLGRLAPARRALPDRSRGRRRARLHRHADGSHPRTGRLDRRDRRPVHRGAARRPEFQHRALSRGAARGRGRDQVDHRSSRPATMPGWSSRSSTAWSICPRWRSPTRWLSPICRLRSDSFPRCGYGAPSAGSPQAGSSR